MRGKHRPEWEKLPYGYRSSYGTKRRLPRRLILSVVIACLIYGLHLAAQRWPSETAKLLQPIKAFTGRVIREADLIRPPARPQQSRADVQTGRAQVVDGDTIRIGRQAFRLHAVDAAESDQTCKRNGVVYACGREAASALRQVIGDQPVSCTRRGLSYNRIVATCTAGGVDIARVMVRAGYALAEPQFGRDYVADELQARKARQGLWSGEFERPSEFRKRKRGG